MIGATQRGRSFTAEDASASSAMMPPSPLLLARMMRITYLSDTTIISAQKIADNPPSTFDVLSGMPWSGLNVSFAA